MQKQYVYKIGSEMTFSWCFYETRGFEIRNWETDVIAALAIYDVLITNQITISNILERNVISCKVTSIKIKML